MKCRLQQTHKPVLQHWLMAPARHLQPLTVSISIRLVLRVLEQLQRRCSKTIPLMLQTRVVRLLLYSARLRFKTQLLERPQFSRKTALQVIPREFISILLKRLALRLLLPATGGEAVFRLWYSLASLLELHSCHSWLAAWMMTLR